MQNTIKQIFLAGAGLVSASKDKAEKIANELIKRGELAMKDKEKFINDLTKKAEQARKSFDKSLEAAVKAILKKLEVPSKKDFNALKRQIEKLQKELDKVEKQKR